MPRLAIEALGGIDPRSVPLPHGTEVTTTIVRELGEGLHAIPQGAIGRVVGMEADGRLRVRIVGRGEIAYARDELIPRHGGQLRFALRRAACERALAPCRVLESTVGSRAWGLASDDSDHDVRGVFVLPFPWTTTLAAAPDVVTSADGSTTYWEVERAIRQALRADANTLEMLFVPSARALDEMGTWLLDVRQAVPSRLIYGAFGRYALSQARGLEQSLRLAEHRAFVLDLLRRDPSTTLDDVARALAAAALGGDDAERVGRAKTYVKQLYRSLFDQGLLGGNTFASLVDLAREGDLELELPRELRPKNAYNLLRIVASGVSWLRTGSPAMEVKGELRDRLLAIKRGDVPLRTVLSWTEAAATELDAARDESPLPTAPEVRAVDAVFRRIREEAARRWLDRAPGPWGSDAPAVPMLEQDDDG